MSRALDDSLRLVHDILDEDRSFLEYLHDENVTERDRVQHALHHQASKPAGPIRPETFINDTCHELQHELEQLESELSFYDTMKKSSTKPASTTRHNLTTSRTGGSTTGATANPRAHPPKRKTAPPLPNPAVATSFDAMLTKLQRDYEHDQAAHVAAQARIQARVAAAHKGAMVFADLQASTERSQYGNQDLPTTTPRQGGAPRNKRQAALADRVLSCEQDTRNKYDLPRGDPTWSRLDAPTQPPNNEAHSRLRSASMQAVRDACSTAIVHEAEAVVHAGQIKQAQAIDGVVERFEIRKRLAVAKLEEACDRETHEVVEATKAELGQEHHTELAHVQDAFMAKRRSELNDVLVDNDRRLEREKKNVVETCQLETDLKRAALQRQLEVDRVVALREIEEKFQADLVALEDRLRHVVSDELKAKRQEVAAALLRREEELLQQGRAEALAVHHANERADVAKLQAALQMGSALRLQQLKDRLDGQRAAKLAEIERVANESLERSLEQLRHEHDTETARHVHATHDRLQQAHQREVESLQQALAIDETRSLNDVTTQLRANHLKRIERVRDDHALRRAERLAQLQQTYEAEYLVRTESLQDELEAQLAADLTDRAAENARALQKEVDARTTHFADVADRLTTELHFLFQVAKKHPGSSLRHKWKQGRDDEAPDALAKLHALGITSRQVNEWIHAVSAEFYDLADQHKVLLESLRQASAQASAWKVKAATLEDGLARQQEKLDKAMADVHEKTRLCQRLYKANEQLLKQLPAPSPP